MATTGQRGRSWKSILSGEVEVFDDLDHAWLEATVVGHIPGRKEELYYVTIGGSTNPVPVRPSHIRQRPAPCTASQQQFRLHEIVEACYKGGWRSGMILATVESVVSVMFPTTREVNAFSSHLVRPRIPHVFDKKPMYKIGEKVEVGRDREVYGYSWFPFLITKVVDHATYLIESEEKLEDGRVKKGIEYVHQRFIRQAAELPSVSDLRPGTAVEVYIDGAWSPGLVCKAMGKGEFEVKIDSKKGDVVVTKAVGLLKLQRTWDGEKWKIVDLELDELEKFIVEWVANSNCSLPEKIHKVDFYKKERFEDLAQYSADGVAYFVLKQSRLPNGSVSRKMADKQHRWIESSFGRQKRDKSTVKVFKYMDGDVKQEFRKMIEVTLKEDPTDSAICKIISSEWCSGIQEAKGGLMKVVATDTNENIALLEKCRHKDEIIENLNKQLYDAKEENIALRKRCQNQEKSIENQEKSIENLNKQLAGIMEENIALRKRCQNQEKSIENQEKSIENLNKQLAGTMEELTLSMEKGCEQNNTIKYLNEELSKVRKQYHDMKMDIRDLYAEGRGDSDREPDQVE